MKRIITVITLVLISQIGYSQGVLGSDIWIKNNAGTRGYVYREGTAFKMWDSTANVYNLAQKLKLDSLYTKINSTLAVTQSGTWNITNVSGTVSLPTGASTSSLQTNGNTLLQGIKTVDSNIFLSVDATYGSVAVIEATTGNIQTSVDNISTWADNNTLPTVIDSTQNPIDGINIYGQVRTNAPSLTDGRSGLLSLTDKGGLRVTLTDLAGAYVAAGGGGGSGGGATALRDSTSTATALTMTGISSLASSATVGWQSDRISNLSTKAIDYKIMVRLSCANTSPANDKAIYAYLIPWWTSDGGTTWYSSSIGTTTLPTGSAGAMTIATPHNLRLLGVLNYTTADMIVQDNFLMSNAYGDNMPDAFSIGIINFSGAALDATSGVNNLISYTPIFKTNR